MPDRDSCANCRHAYPLTKLDYSHGGCVHTQMEGFVCMAFSDEREADWMVGLELTGGFCEAYENYERMTDNT